MSEYRFAREGNRKVRFEERVLELLERIAIALENPVPKVEYIDPIGRAAEKDEDQIYFDVDATVCRCGNDPKRACSQCTSARLAWFYNQNPDYRP